MIRYIAFMLVLMAALTAVAGPPCNTGVCNVQGVAVQSQFLTIPYPGYSLFQLPQASYAGGNSVGASYEQTKHAKVEAELAEVKAMLRALAEKGLADGTVSARAFATIAQPTINQYCVGCHRVAAPDAGKGFPLTDVAALTSDQRMRIIELVMSDDPAQQMPKPNSPQGKAWNAEAAGAVLKEVSSAKSRPAVPVEAR